MSKELSISELIRKKELLHLRIYDIDWDTDGVEVDLPTDLEVEWDYGLFKNGWDEDEVVDWLTDEFGWCVNGFSVVVLV
jgi:hypothetical protein|tara:strand:- start:1155 stop:1391 length:237 start_codon:yes stop_codon:yes gene_type:complete